MRKSLGLIAFTLIAAIQTASAQVEPPDRRFLFVEDRKKNVEEEQRAKAIRSKQKQLAKEAKLKGFPFDINAGAINYDSQANAIRGEGGIIIGYSNSVIEAEKGSVYVQEKRAELEGDVRITDVAGNISADSVDFKLDTKTGTMKNADIYFEQGYYRLQAKDAQKLEGQTYEMTDANLTTCNCPDAGATTPWTLDADRAKITRDGYGQTWGTIIRAYDTPVCYLPYLIFPAKTTRQTGFLPPTLGQGNRNGFEISAPFFWAINSSADATITPIVQTASRIGIDSEARKAFSKRHNLRLGGLYLNEGLREGDLLGTIVTGFNDPSIDENRFAGILDYSYLNDKDSKIPFQARIDGKYISDDFILREFGQFNVTHDEPIAPYNSRFLTSRGVIRAGVLPSHTFEASSEFTQAIVDDDDFVIQRAPELALTGMNTFKPFGKNALGAKVVVMNSANYTNFLRQKSTEGGRAEIYEQVKVPFHFKNYFDASVGGDIRLSQYNLNETEVIDPDKPSVVQEVLPDSSDRIVPGLNGNISTVFERVYSLSEGNFLKDIAELGTQGRKGELVRVKHTVEPLVRYRFVPDVDQSDNPQFDIYDKLAARSVFTYGVTQRLFGRFDNRNKYLYGIEEATPNVEDLGTLSSTDPVDQTFNFGGTDIVSDEYKPYSSGARTELANLKLFQSYDIYEDTHDSEEEKKTGEETDPLSDFGVQLTLLPNEYVRLQTGANISPDGFGFSSYTIGTQLLDKRGDQLRAQLRFIDSEPTPTRQLDLGAELKITERLKLGYFTRYDDVDSGFIENRVGLRLASSCKCWLLDLNVVDQLNPEQTRVAFNLTLVGLGELGNTFFQARNQQNNQN